MPADSETTLPHTWRPRGVRIAGAVGAAAVLALLVGSWLAMSPEVRARFGLADLYFLIGFCALAGVVLGALMWSRVEASRGGLIVVNGFRKRSFEWAEVIAIRLRSGAPWAELDIADGTTVPVMALQGSDGDYAKNGIRTIRRWAEEYGSAPDPR